MCEEPDRESNDVLPPGINQALGLAWVLLFAGRWIGGPLLLGARVLTPSMISDLDDRVLVRCYLALLAATILVVVLRTMRRGKAQSTRRAAQQLDSAVTTRVSENCVSADGKEEADSR